MHKNTTPQSSLIIQLFWFSLGCIALAVGLSFSRESYWQIQQSGFLYLNQTMQVLPVWFWDNITELGNAFVLLPLLALLTINLNRAWVAVLIAAPVTLLFTHLLKYIAHMPRPGAVLDVETFHIIGPTLQGFNSAPSGHTVTVFALCAVFLYSIKFAKACQCYRVLTGLTLLVATLIGLSRVAVGAHWPIDVFLGALIGWYCGGLGVKLIRHKGPTLVMSDTMRVVTAVLFVFWGTSLIVVSFLSDLPPVWLLSSLCAMFVAIYQLQNLASSTQSKPANPFFSAGSAS